MARLSSPLDGTAEVTAAPCDDRDAAGDGERRYVPDWRLPPGVSRAMWDYLHDPSVARSYDSQVADTPLLHHDRAFVVKHCRRPGRFVDLGCGTGRIALAMAQLGHRVLAVDLSAEMLTIVGEKAAAAGVAIDRIQANLVELDALADASFDYAACLFGTLGMLVGTEPRRRFITQVRRLLRPGGVFVLHVHNRWFHLGTRAGRRLLLGNWWRSCTGRGVVGDFAMPPHQGLGSITMHLFTRREIVGLLRRCGFAIIEVRPLSVRSHGCLTAPWWFGRLRAYGYLIAAQVE
ncbi:MAG: class I SAM-dependent methyltransferase [Gemmataceae bacterium]|nr:class I SAM-dependent methyltransferase [Gemmataceae bacterium]